MILYDYLLLDDLFWTGSILLLSLLRRPTQRVGRQQQLGPVNAAIPLYITFDYLSLTSPDRA